MSEFATFWITSGLTFWFGMLGEAGMPDRWTSDNSRYPGAADWLFFNLPFCLVVGPLGWLAFLIVRLRP